MGMLFNGKNYCPNGGTRDGGVCVAFYTSGICVVLYTSGVVVAIFIL